MCQKWSSKKYETLKAKVQRGHKVLLIFSLSLVLRRNASPLSTSFALNLHCTQAHQQFPEQRCPKDTLSYWHVRLKPTKLQTAFLSLLLNPHMTMVTENEKFINNWLHCLKDIKGSVHHKVIFFLLPVVLFMNVDCFGVSCLVLEILAFLLLTGTTFLKTKLFTTRSEDYFE